MRTYGKYSAAAWKGYCRNKGIISRQNSLLYAKEKSNSLNCYSLQNIYRATIQTKREFFSVPESNCLVEHNCRKQISVLLEFSRDFLFPLSWQFKVGEMK